MKSYINLFRNYANFSGCLKRKPYWIAVLKKTEDIDALKNCRDQIDLLTLRMGDLEQRKVDLDRERKATINILKREYYEQVAALEKQFSQEGGEA